MIVVSPEKIAQYTQAGWWGERTLGELFIDTALRQPDLLAVADPPNRPAITGDAAQRWTWGELLTQVGRYCAFLDQQGIRKDDIIVVQMPNCVEMHAIYLACAVSGVVVSPVPMQYRAHELSHVLETTRARVAITTARVGKNSPAQQWAEQKSISPVIDRVWVYGLPVTNAAVPAASTLQAIEPALEQSVPWTATQLRAHLRAIGLTANDVLTICWTSGTEAMPKGVPRSHNEWLIVGLSVIDAGGLQPGAQLLIPYPFVNMAGVSTSLAAWLMVGGGLHHHHPFDIDVFIEQLVNEAVHYTVAAPAVLSMLLKDAHKLQGVDFSKLQRIGSGGGPVASWMVEEFAQQFGVEIVNYFGSNEGAALASTPQDMPDRIQRAHYFPRFGVAGFEWAQTNSKKVRTRLVDLDSGDDITTPGRVGELRFMGPTIFSGYFNAPELSARAFDEQGYYRTGDLFEIAGDQDQFYRFAGRHKDIVIRGGMNISSEEVEGLMLGHPKVREVAVIGWPDEVLGERVCAVVVPATGADIALPELVEFLREKEKIAAFKLPEKLILVQTLPRNPLGKVLKRALRQQFLEEETA